MTTAWAYAVRGNALAAVEASAAGTLLLLASLFASAWLLAVAALGGWLGGRPRPRTAAWVATAWLVVALAEWARRCVEG
jgi:hypothetical protein